jgi:hypothetical protein
VTQLVFVPLSRADARALRDAGVTEAELPAYAATPSLLAAHGFAESDREEAEYAALSYAGAHAAVTDTPETLRLVLAADVPVEQVSADPDSAYGLVRVGGLRWTEVQALFSDEEAAAAAVAAARQAAAGRELDVALTLPAVEVAVDEADLLWFAPEELDRLP